MPLNRNLGALVVVVVLIAAASAFLFQVSTERTLERAEALQFRRMLVTKAGQDGSYRFFYATNRDRERADGPLEDHFGTDATPDLEFGRFDTKIEPALGIGMLVNPTDWFQNEEIRLQDVRPLSQAIFLEDLRAQVLASPERSLLVNVNGFRERFPSALRKTAFLAHVLDIDTPFLVFDWPGDQGASPVGYRRAQTIARESGAALARVLMLLLREVRPEKLSLVANSMGAEVVVSAFSMLFEQADLADSAAEFEHVVLTAPDVSHEEFGRQFQDEILALAEDLTVYVSSNDRALLVSRLINRERRLGESTVDPANPDQSEEAARVLELLEAGSSIVSLVDVTPVNRTRNFHNFSLETPEYFDDLFLRLTNDEAPGTRLRYRVRTPRGVEYWVLTRGR